MEPKENKKKRRLLRMFAILLAGAGVFFIVRAVTTDRAEPSTQAQTNASALTPTDQHFSSMIVEAGRRSSELSGAGIETAVVAAPFEFITPQSPSSSPSPIDLGVERPPVRSSQPRPAVIPSVVPVARAAEVARPAIVLEEIRFGTKVVGGTPMITVDVLARNTGSTASSSVPVSVVGSPSSDPGTSNPAVLGELSLPSIAAGATQPASSSFPAPSSGGITSVCISSSRLFAIAAATPKVCQSFNLPTTTPTPSTPSPTSTQTCVVSP